MPGLVPLSQETIEALLTMLESLYHEKHEHQRFRHHHKHEVPEDDSRLESEETALYGT